MNLDLTPNWTRFVEVQSRLIAVDEISNIEINNAKGSEPYPRLVVWLKHSSKPLVFEYRAGTEGAREEYKRLKGLLGV